MKSLSFAIVALALAGCASQAPVLPPPERAPMLADNAFKQPSEAITADDLFKVTPAMAAYIKGSEFQHELNNNGLEQGLVNALYQKGGLMLEYDTSITRPAGITFANKSGNCLSLVIMTAAFAKALDMTVYYNDVAIDETWSRMGGLYVFNRHVNVSLQKNHIMANETRINGMRMIIDFLPAEQVAGFRTRRLSEDDIIAMYLNNRAAEALGENRVDDAYWWARKSVQEHPYFISAYNTLGVALVRRGQNVAAERAFKSALEREPQSLVVLYNLMPLLQQMGKTAEAQALQQRISAIAKEPPFFYFNKGMDAMKSGEYLVAKAMFEREVDREPYNDEFHFWLGMAKLKLGDTRSAREEVALALKNSTTYEAQRTYSAKLDHMRAMRGDR